MPHPITRRQFAAITTAVALSPTLRAESGGELPFRQVHLDFHTGEFIPGVGAAFSPDAFGETLKRARVNSINVFAKCHHGYAYYSTRIATPHPHLKADMLGGMVRACRANGIHVLYYYSLVWDVVQSRLHPEWRARARDGALIGQPPGTEWPWMCMNTPYLDHVIRENEEILANYDVDGAWYDILKTPEGGCFCKYCVDDRKQRGLSDSPQDLKRHGKLVALQVEQRLNAVVHRKFPGGLTFYNSRLIVGMRDELDNYSHIEIESLPTGGWGYSHFQQRVRYMRTLGKQMVGMTGRFHKSWGDFGGLKNQAALDFECLNFIANGTKCCVGDQLHPRGVLEAATYDLIGNTYRKVEALEPWSRGVEAEAEIGVISSAPFAAQSTQKLTPEDQGFTNMLVELHQQFNVLDLEADFSGYKLIVVPDVIPASEPLVRKLDAFAAADGAVIVSGESLLDKTTGNFAWKALGVRYLGPAKYKGEYFAPSKELLRTLDRSDGLLDYDYFLYQPGVSIESEAGSAVLASYTHPYFDRAAPDHFSSHAQTPPGPRTNEPLVTLNGRVAYIANPVFRSYSQDGYGALKALVAQLLHRLLPRPLIVAPSLPSTAQVTLVRQPSAQRSIAHVLYYPLTRRAPSIDIVEEPGLLVDQELRLRMERAPRRAVLIPENRPLPLRYADGYAICTLPRVLGHQAVAFEWA